MTIVTGMVLKFYLAAWSQKALLFISFIKKKLLFVLHADYYKDGKISSSSSELHGSSVVMVCIKLSP